MEELLKYKDFFQQSESGITFTGVENNFILKNFTQLSKCFKSLKASIPLIPNKNDQEQQYKNSRNSKYAMGLYLMTAHQHFGSITSAIPHCRKKGEPFASGISPVNGLDKNDPTAIINSMNFLDHSKAGNGINFNMRFDSFCLRGDRGITTLDSLINTYFRRGEIQLQLIVLNPQILLEARDNPERYPNLLVRVSGYSAYFNDLTPEMKNEIIKRTCNKVQGN